ncbi:NTP transferase domain-containing protein [Candidatus Woesearchaeota archaeon]|nr:NTP transferase domain-containing protein [Candidatus Woesearchaeota archaeon]
MKTTAIILARTNSTRLPNKVRIKIGGKTIIEHIVNRLNSINIFDDIILATTRRREDIHLVNLVNDLNIKVFRGSEENVLKRFYDAAKCVDAKVIARINGDCPFFSRKGLIKNIKTHKTNNYDYTYNKSITGIVGGYPLGTGTEVISIETLEKLEKTVKDTKMREHITLYILLNKTYFKIAKVTAPENLQDNKLKLTLDTKEDLILIKKIFDKLYSKDSIITLEKIFELFKKEPDLRKINSIKDEKFLSFFKKTNF